MKSYQMRQQLKKGEAAERWLDSRFVEEFHITTVTRQEQRQGIDRIFTRKSDGRKWAIEYKADKTAAQTGNAFVEIVSVDTYDKPGWALYCQADFILYYIIGIGPVYVLRPSDIRSKLTEWESQFQKRSVSNNDYNTIGILVPLSEFEKLAVQIINV